ncbi:hypothetical protein GGX14DRAFT_404092 [Mycena pura]|uniref:Uncharacterized protein n=1 Tax=Mycena pura TaxID=153505 RepID=A0AAD6UYP4_9AGAR|nr:hypothetical protein GGX14DRAFT_404092 [Mycena pura]
MFEVIEVDFDPVGAGPHCWFLRGHSTTGREAPDELCLWVKCENWRQDYIDGDYPIDIRVETVNQELNKGNTSLRVGNAKTDQEPLNVITRLQDDETTHTLLLQYASDIPLHAGQFTPSIALAGLNQDCFSREGDRRTETKRTLGGGSGSGSTELETKSGVEGGVGGRVGMGGGDAHGARTSPGVALSPVVAYLGVERPRYAEMVVDDRELHALGRIEQGLMANNNNDNDGSTPGRRRMGGTTRRGRSWRTIRRRGGTTTSGRGAAEMMGQRREQRRRVGWRDDTAVGGGRRGGTTTSPRSDWGGGAGRRAQWQCLRYGKRAAWRSRRRKAESGRRGARDGGRQRSDMATTVAGRLAEAAEHLQLRPSRPPLATQSVQSDRCGEGSSKIDDDGDDEPSSYTRPPRAPFSCLLDSPAALFSVLSAARGNCGGQGCRDVISALSCSEERPQTRPPSASLRLALLERRPSLVASPPPTLCQMWPIFFFYLVPAAATQGLPEALAALQYRTLRLFGVALPCALGGKYANAQTRALIFRPAPIAFQLPLASFLTFSAPLPALIEHRPTLVASLPSTLCQMRPNWGNHDFPPSLLFKSESDTTATKYFHYIARIIPCVCSVPPCPLYAPTLVKMHAQPTKPRHGCFLRAPAVPYHSVSASQIARIMHVTSILVFVTPPSTLRQILRNAQKGAFFPVSAAVVATRASPKPAAPCLASVCRNCFRSLDLRSARASTRLGAQLALRAGRDWRCARSATGEGSPGSTPTSWRDGEAGHGTGREGGGPSPVSVGVRAAVGRCSAGLCELERRVRRRAWTGAGADNGNFHTRSHSFMPKLPSRLSSGGKGSTGEQVVPSEREKDVKERRGLFHLITFRWWPSFNAGERASQIIYATGFVDRLVAPPLSDPRSWKPSKMELELLGTNVALHKPPNDPQTIRIHPAEEWRRKRSCTSSSSRPVFLHDGVPKEDAAQREEEWKDYALAVLLRALAGTPALGISFLVHRLKKRSQCVREWLGRQAFHADTIVDVFFPSSESQERGASSVPRRPHLTPAMGRAGDRGSFAKCDARNRFACIARSLTLLHRTVPEQATTPPIRSLARPWNGYERGGSEYGLGLGPMLGDGQPQSASTNTSIARGSNKASQRRFRNFRIPSHTGSAVPLVIVLDSANLVEDPGRRLDSRPTRLPATAHPPLREASAEPRVHLRRQAGVPRRRTAVLPLRLERVAQQRLPVLQPRDTRIALIMAVGTITARRRCKHDTAKGELTDCRSPANGVAVRHLIPDSALLAAHLPQPSVSALSIGDAADIVRVVSDDDLKGGLKPPES